MAEHMQVLRHIAKEVDEADQGVDERSGFAPSDTGRLVARPNALAR
jgi:hypothetical protein